MTSISRKLLTFIFKFLLTAKRRTGFAGAKRVTGKCSGSYNGSLDERKDGLETGLLRPREAGPLHRASEELTGPVSGLGLEDEEEGVTHEFRERKLKKQHQHVPLTKMHCLSVAPGFRPRVLVPGTEGTSTLPQGPPGRAAEPSATSSALSSSLPGLLPSLPSCLSHKNHFWSRVPTASHPSAPSAPASHLVDSAQSPLGIPLTVGTPLLPHHSTAVTFNRCAARIFKTCND